MKGTVLSLSRGSQWTIGEQIGHGGFGHVYEAWSGEAPAAAKFVPKAGGDRELLFVDLGGARNVVPIIDHGEHGDYWVLVMPRADLSLRELLNRSGALELGDGLDVLKDVLDALSDLDGRVVHRDIKPENVLRLDGRWSLADFGIARYAEASTAPDTQKFAMSPPYAAPERWRNEHATIAADIYALGIIAHELLTGQRPFDGTNEQLRDQHLHTDAPALTGVPMPLEALVEECLYKAADARPRPANARQRLERVNQPPPTGGLAQLEAANRAEVGRRAEQARNESEAQTEDDRRKTLDKSARQAVARIVGALREAIAGAASAAEVQGGTDKWTIKLNQATLTFSLSGDPVRINRQGPHHHAAPVFDVVTCGRLTLSIPQNRYGYRGRSHSLWFCDAQVAGEYRWFESAFMKMALMGAQPPEVPFALNPGPEAAAAIGPGMMEYQAAWPYERLIERAGTQHGFVTTAELEELDVPPVYLRKLAAAGRAQQRGRGLYRLTALPATDHDEYHEAVLWAGLDAVIGGEAALRLWDLADVNPRHIEVIISPGHRVRRKDAGRFVARAAALAPDEIDFVDGIPVVVPARVIRQVIDGGLDGSLVDQAIATAVRRGLLGRLAEARLRVAAADRHASTVTAGRS